MGWGEWRTKSENLGIYLVSALNGSMVLTCYFPQASRACKIGKAMPEIPSLIDFEMYENFLKHLK